MLGGPLVQEEKGIERTGNSLCILLNKKEKKGLADDCVIEANINSFSTLNYFIIPKCWLGCLRTLQNLV